MKPLRINFLILIFLILNVSILSLKLGENSVGAESFGYFEGNDPNKYDSGFDSSGTKEEDNSKNGGVGSVNNSSLNIESSMETSPGAESQLQESKKDDTEAKSSEKQESAAVESTYVDDDEEVSGDLSSEGDPSESEVDNKKEIKQEANNVDSKAEDNSVKSQEDSDIIKDQVVSLERDIPLEKSSEEQSIVPKLNTETEGSESFYVKEGEKNADEENKFEPIQSDNVQKASTSIKDGVEGSSIGNVVPSTLDLLLGVVQPTRSFIGEKNRKPLDIEFGRKKTQTSETELEEIKTKLKAKYIPTPSCNDIVNKFEWKNDLVATPSQAAFKTIFEEITTLKHMTNVQAEKTINSAFDVLKDPVSEGISPQEALSLYICEVDKQNGRTVYQKLIEYGYLSSLLHPIANKMWGCVKYGHYYDLNGNNPLHLAAKSNSLQVVDFVLRLIKDPIEIKVALEEKNVFGQTPLDVSIDEKRPSIIRRFKTTYRTMSNYVKKLDPEAIAKERNRQKIMTEAAAMFCKPVLSFTSSEEKAVQAAFETSNNVNERIMKYSNEQLKNELVQQNLRSQKRKYQDSKNLIASERNNKSIKPHNGIDLDSSLTVLRYVPDKSESDEADISEIENMNDLDDLSKNQIHGEIIDDTSDEGSSELQYGSSKDDGFNNENKNSSDSDSNSGDLNEEKPVKSKNFLEKVLFWSIIIFCIVFTVVLLLIWFATKV
ncbi:secreted protein with ankyrin repeatsplus transmembrane domain or GPI anchor [Cryptosporidium ryanae]|uniref:secreted protein with ankyrin repeatsplus transmembrane domain or GPI anchor n=1 Tax=Cryptosporidium ryanae TaxID=515981 RepID=UPI00351A0DCD|nr:secreted protein with ankyrin repeatsplus transmembrane domain or GPI anchor [Cryptosporidium ryanae]